MDAHTAFINGLIPPLLGAMKLFKSGSRSLFVGKATDGAGQQWDIYCSPGDKTCLGEAVKESSPLPFYDFGYVAWPREALKENLTEVVPTIPSGTGAVCFVHPFASIILALETHPLAAYERDGRLSREQSSCCSNFAARFGDLWGGNWLLPPYYALKAAGHPVYLASRCVPGQVNVLMAYSKAYLGDLERLAQVCGAAVIACADTSEAPALLAAGCHVIVQNELQAASPRAAAASPPLAAAASPPPPATTMMSSNGRAGGAERDGAGGEVGGVAGAASASAGGQMAVGARRQHTVAQPHTLPMFPQQRLQRRRADRGSRLERIVFMGDRHQIDPVLASREFGEVLNARFGIAFDVVDKSRIPEWGDYSDADLVLAVRPPGSHPELKPPSKLINAWLAGVPALLGAEPAYRKLRRNANDYLEVSSPHEVLEALSMLRSDPERYAAMRRQCEKRAREFSEPAIAAQWADVLFGRVAQQHPLGTPSARGEAVAARAQAQGAPHVDHGVSGSPCPSTTMKEKDEDDDDDDDDYGQFTLV